MSGFLLKAAVDSLVQPNYRLWQLRRRAVPGRANAAITGEAAFALRILGSAFHGNALSDERVTFKCPRIHRRHLLR
jgi:hypothetical protein